MLWNFILVPEGKLDIALPELPRFQFSEKFYIAQKMKFFIKDFSSKCDQIRSLHKVGYDLKPHHKKEKI